VTSLASRYAEVVLVFFNYLPFHQLTLCKPPKSMMAKELNRLRGLIVSSVNVRLVFLSN
jgi:hypothetical protein